MRRAVRLLTVFLSFALAGAVLLATNATPAQAQEEQYVDLNVEIEVLSGTNPNDTRIHLHVGNAGNRTAHDVIVEFDNRARSRPSTPGVGLNSDLPAGTANFEVNQSIRLDTFEWRIPEIPPRTSYTARLGGVSAATAVRSVSEFWATVRSGSHESQDRKANNSHRAWEVFSQIDAAIRGAPAEPDYSVEVSVKNQSASAATFTVSVVLPNTSGSGPSAVIGEGCVNVRLTSGLTAGSTTLNPANNTALDLIRQRFFDIDGSRSRHCLGPRDAYGVFVLPRRHFGTASLELPVTVNSGATLSEQCLTAELFANPPAGGGRYYDDPTDNMAKVCPWAPTVPLQSGTVHIWTLYSCVGVTTPPCDGSDDVRVRATVPDPDGVILDSGAAVFHIPDHPLARAYDSHSGSVNAGTAVSWQTSCWAGRGSCTAINTWHDAPHREEFGVHLRWNIIPFNDHWRRVGPPATGIWDGMSHNTTARGLVAGTNPPGAMNLRFSGRTLRFEMKAANSWSYTRAGTSTYKPSGDVTSTSRYFAEFEKLGTYVLDYTLRAVHYDTNQTGDCATGISLFDNSANSFCDTETYIFHVGPMADLEVRDGGASAHVAAGRNALTIVAANNGPDPAPGARVTGLPRGAEVISVSKGSYNAGTGEWNIGEMQPGDYYQSHGQTNPTLVLAASADATVSIANVVNYTVCISGSAETRHTLHQITSEAACTGTNSWHEGTVYDPKSNNSANITIRARAGTGGGGDEAPTLGDLSVHAPAAGLSWSEVKAVNTVPVTSYQVQWSPNGVDGWQNLKNGHKLPELIDVDIESDLTRYYRVRAVNGAGYAGPWSKPRAVNDRVERPVSGLRAEPGYGQVTLIWSKVAGATGYEVQTGGGDWDPVGDVSRHTVTGLASRPHVFRVRPVTGTGEGDVMEATATPLPAAPGNLTAIAGDGRVALSWTVVAGATGYQVQQDGGAWQNVGTVSAHTVTGLDNGTTYRFQVRAVNGALVGAVSSAQATPQAGAGPPGLHPNAPAWLRAQAGYSDFGGQVTLTWDAVPNAEGYECRSWEVGKFKENSEKDWWDEFPMCPTTNTSVTLDAYPQTSYDFQVRAWRTIDNVRYYSGWKQVRLNHWDWPSPFQGR